MNLREFVCITIIFYSHHMNSTITSLRVQYHVTVSYKEIVIQKTKMPELSHY